MNTNKNAVLFVTSTEHPLALVAKLLTVVGSKHRPLRHVECVGQRTPDGSQLFLDFESRSRVDLFHHELRQLIESRKSRGARFLRKHGLRVVVFPSRPGQHPRRNNVLYAV